MAVLAEANIQYEYSKTKLIAGRQIFESFITRSNDTKMIPNTFEGAVLEIKDIPKTRIRGAFFTAQKLRDHTEFHDVITFKDGNGDSWGNNDDSAIHKGLSYNNFKNAGADVNHQLIVVDVRNKSINGLKVDVTYASVPNVVASITGELNYKIALPSGYSLTPGVRYMHQMDDGGGVIGGATLKGTLAGQSGSALGYSNIDSLNSQLAMARLTLKKGPLKVQIAYSQVAGSGADIVAPWRGFPTGGYTRAMAQYNWYAGTKTTCAEVNYDFGKAGLVHGFSALARFAMQDFDEAKQAAGVQADSNILHMDLRETITPDLYAKIRIGLVTAAEIEKVSGNK
ncbi:MAG: OprD family outer membrane porin [Sulfurimonas sp.]|nr:OprD family outer membrane porin [Sulfurimonas sp.]